jgi:tRNA1Val (adenine37-N6)-methyltransferase
MKSSGSPEVELRSEESIDYFMDGRLRLIQSKRGYRFSIDAVLLAEFVTIRPADVVVDLGTGCGIIPLLLLLERPVGRTLGLEIQTDLASQAARNAVLNGFAHRMAVIRGDIREPPLTPSSVDVVLCNPPYRPRSAGRINPDPRRAIARHEMLASLDDILKAAVGVLKNRGRLAVIYPAPRLVDVLSAMRRVHLEPKRLRIVYPGLGSEAKLALIEASLAGRPGLKIMPPLLDQGDYSIGA